MASTNQIVRNRLDVLRNQLANPDKASVADDGHHINNPSALNNLHIPQFDFEHPDVETNTNFVQTYVSERITEVPCESR